MILTNKSTFMAADLSRPRSSAPLAFLVRQSRSSFFRLTPIILAALLFAGGSPALAGVAEVPPAASPKTVVEKKPEPNPLSFLDGKIVLDIQERFRFEYRNDTFDFNSAVNSLTDDAFFLQRFRIGIALKPVDWLKFYAQAQDALELDSKRPDVPGALGAEGNNAFDLRQAYIQIGPKSVNLTLGRQVLAYGDERLIGPADWNNISRTWDATRLQFVQPKFSVDLFAATLVNIYRDAFDYSDFFNGSETHRDQIFAGIYATTSAVDFQVMDFYVLALDQEVPNPTALVITTPTFTGLSGRQTEFVTLGTRLKGDPKKLQGWEYEGEFAFQTGKVADLNLTAFAVHVGGGYNFSCAWKPRLFVEYNYASGDRDPLDGDIETFQNLFPSNHKFYGFMDLFSWQNLSNPALCLRLQPTKKLTLETDFLAFWLANTNDAWYRANGTARVRTLNPAARAASSYTGSEIDLLATYKPWKWLTVVGGYSHFFPGAYLKDTGAGDPANFVYLQTTFNF